MEGDRTRPNANPRPRNRTWIVRSGRGLAVAFAMVVVLTLAGSIAILSSGWNTALIDPIEGDPQAQLAVASGSGTEIYDAYAGFAVGPAVRVITLNLSLTTGG